MALCSSRRRDWASATRSRRSSVCRESREAERSSRAEKGGVGLREIGKGGEGGDMDRDGLDRDGQQGEVIRDWWSEVRGCNGEPRKGGERSHDEVDLGNGIRKDVGTRVRKLPGWVGIPVWRIPGGGDGGADRQGRVVVFTEGQPCSS